MLTNINTYKQRICALFYDHWLAETNEGEGLLYDGSYHSLSLCTGVGWNKAGQYIHML